MKVLVLTGTDSSSWIAEELIKSNVTDENVWVIQSSLNSGRPKKNVSVVNSLSLSHRTAISFDVVVSHAGAGSTFWALENRKRLISIIDLRRTDKHQSDLGFWLERENLAIVKYNVIPTAEDFSLVLNRKFAVYYPEQFKIQKLISSFLISN